VRAFRPVWVALRAAVLATAVYWVVLFIIERSGWKGLALPWLDATEYVVFFVVFFLGMLMTPKS
jgi:hypothetical protein